jgi:3'-phosphoadenosine 5'-phosphosulfate sulfotransferase (PAPS reductase)/FAD synthetase
MAQSALTVTAPNPTPIERLNEALAILDEAVQLHRPTHLFGLFSGGHDSLCATHVASQHPLFNGAVHINTGIGVDATNQFVVDTCRREGWALKQYLPPVAFDDIVLKHGFPGPGGHFFMYIRLKERCLRQLVRDHKRDRNDRIMLVSGVRIEESARRMGHDETVYREGAKVWVAPILNWSSDDKNDYIEAQGLPRNPVVGALCMSGECLCGAFARPDEMVEIETFYPETARRIRDLEARAREVGVHARWGTRPPREPKEERQLSLPLCHSCQARRETD